MTSYEEMTINSFIEWLDNNDIDYQMRGTKVVCVDFPDGSYIRVSDFDTPHSLYIRDTGIIYRMSVFDLAQSILERKGENE